MASRKGQNYRYQNKVQSSLPGNIARPLTLRIKNLNGKSEIRPISVLMPFSPS